jgi:hypothetical protein
MQRHAARLRLWDRPNLQSHATVCVRPGLVAIAESGNENFSATLSGFEELGALPKVTPGPPPTNEPETIANPTGAIYSPGKGTLQLSLDKNLQTVSYTLTYSSLTSPITQAHIHFGKRHVSGGIMVFFCTNNANGPAGTPNCPTTSPATVTGTWIAGSVVAVPSQNITAHDFNALIAALESDTAYGNIHTTLFPAGEIRGQIRKPEDD